jgi:1-phosphofructokinase family hexose kinase
MSIITIGFNPALDRVLECPDFHVGGHQPARQVARLAAGKAANVSRALAQIGTDSIATGFVGTDELEFFHEQLLECGPGRILCHFVEVTGKTRENISILDPKRRLETHLRDRGFVVTSEEIRVLERRLLHDLRPGDIAVFSGSLCEGVSTEYFGQLLDQCAAAGAKVIVDTNGEAAKEAARHPLWLAKPNLAELGEMVGKEIPNAASAARDAASGLLKQIEQVLVSRGNAGAVLVTRQGAWSARMATRDVPIRTVGCGDHLVAGFIAERVAGRDMEAALRMGVALATARALSPQLEEVDSELIKAAQENVVIEAI